jgi:hypothetical protein
MKAKDRRALYKKDLNDRHKENYANRDNSGKFGDVYSPEMKAKVKFFKCKEDDHEIYIVPYITGDQHPRLPEGRGDFVLDIFVHRKVGINEDSIVCLNRTYKEKCPICEYQAQLKEDEDNDHEAEIKELNPTRRNLFNIVCQDSPKEEKLGVQIFDVSQWLFTKPLEELAHKKHGGGEIAYADVDEGKVISFRKKGSGATNTEYTAFEFKDRGDIPDEILDAAVSLDQLIYKPTYEEVLEIFRPEESEDDPPPKKEVKKEVKKEKEEEEEEQPPEEEKPKSKGLLKKKSEEKDVPSKVDENLECPGGADFGTDFDEYEECRTCDLKEECKAKKEELEKPPEPPKKKLLTKRG